MLNLSYRKRCEDLGNALEVHACDEANRVARPFLRAQEAVSSGRLGVNNATDLHVAIAGLTDQIVGCKEKPCSKACPLKGILPKKLVELARE